MALTKVSENWMMKKRSLIVLSENKSYKQRVVQPVCYSSFGTLLRYRYIQNQAIQTKVCFDYQITHLFQKFNVFFVDEKLIQKEEFQFEYKKNNCHFIIKKIINGPFKSGKAISDKNKSAVIIKKNIYVYYFLIKKKTAKL